jgi:long-chain fatty acid transport protein
LILSASQAEAAGLYFSDRGVRPIGRGGAFVAGADDGGAAWYNPAGLADAGTAGLADFSFLRFSNEYTRELRVLDADGTWRQFKSPTIHGSSPPIPFPTMVGTYNFGDRKQWTIAGGVLAPMVALASYSATINGEPSPARYALGSFDGSLLAIPGIWGAWKATKQLRFGLGLLALAGVFQSEITFSASPQDRLIGAPEQPEYDADARLRVGPIVAPTLNGGVTYVAAPAIRFGLSGQLPMVVSAPATMQVRLPTSAVFDSARQNGEDAHVRFVLPAIVRAGIEVRPTEETRLELAYVREFWSVHQTIDATPKGVTLDGITGLPPQVKIPVIQIPRGFEDSNSVRLGGEYRIKASSYLIDVRMGASYESSAVPKEYLSLSALDFEKVMISIGGSLHVGKNWRLDAVYAHLFASSVYVDPAIARIPRINPIKGNIQYEEPVNGGTYSASADIIGVGAQYKF